MAMVDKASLAHMGTEPLSTDPYISAEYFEREREMIFRRAWLFVGRIEELPEKGDFLVKDFDVCGTSIIVTRGRDGHIRAFHNVCSHRQAKLVWEGSGNASRFSCKYHGWGFGLDGQLKSVPDAESFYDLDVKSCGLTSVNLEIWRGFIFVNFAEEPEQTLADYMAPIAGQLADHLFTGCTSYVGMTADVDVNWKAMLDNFQETYHLSFIHDRTVGDRATGDDNPFGHPLKFDFFGLHRFMSIWGNSSHKPTPIEMLAGRYGGTSGLGASQQTDHYKALRPANWQLDVHGIFPNLLIEVSPTFFYTIEILPLAVDRTRWVTRMFLPQATNAGQRFSQEYNIAAYRDTVAEDVGVLKTLQAAMASRAKGSIQFQANEVLCRHTYNAIESVVNGTPMSTMAAE